MKKNHLITILFASLLLLSCSENNTENAIVKPTTEISKPNLVTKTYSDTNGNELEVKFDNLNGFATIKLGENIIELKQEESASGTWYKNEQYELRGKGNDLTLKKGDSTLFYHQDDVVFSTVKNKAGDRLDMKFNNTQGTVKIYLNGGEEIELIAVKSASGIWYKNENYELRGKGNNLELTLNEELLFQNIEKSK